MSRLLNYYQQQIIIGMAVQLQYRAGMLIWVLANLTQPIIFLSVWRAAVGEGQIAGYDMAGFSAYFLVLTVVDHLTNTWSLWTMEGLVQRGELSQYLLRALNPIHTEAAYNISYKILMFMAMFGVVIVLSIIFRPVLNPPLWAVVMFIPVVVLGGVLSFMLGWIVALSAFWMTRVNALARLYFLIVLFFAGRLAPLDVLPPSLQTLATVLPFRWMVAFPVELLLGRVAPDEAVLGIVIQIGWVGVAFALAHLAWRVGIRRYSAVGG